MQVLFYLVLIINGIISSRVNYYELRGYYIRLIVLIVYSVCSVIFGVILN